MQLTTLGLAIGLALALSATGANAADWNNGDGGLKGGGSAIGTPIPAPIPYAETFKWYLRADIGGGFVAPEPKASERGMTYGFDRDPATGGTFGMNPAWFNSDFNTFGVFGAGAGYYFTPNMRGDITFDARTKSEVKGNGNYSYLGDPALYAGAITRFDGTVTDRTQVRSNVLLANVYLDLTDRGSRFVPYIGLGAGLAVRTMERQHLTGETGTNITNPLNPIAFAQTSFAGNSKANQVAPAVAATAGVAYTISPGLVFDLNYRFTYIGSVEFATNVNFSQVIAANNSSALSRLKIDETMEHSLRAGLRWNVW